MLNKTLGVIAVMGLLATPALAQEPPEKPTPKPQPAEQPKPVPREQALVPRAPVNVRLELTITDQTGPGEPMKKVITMIVADGQSGSIRSKAAVKVATSSATWQYRDLPINVDARPFLLGSRADGTLRVDLGLEYQPTAPAGGNASQGVEGMSNLNERISVILESGKPLTISQAADPTSDRRISVELKATILK